jgi:hypothetical protein
MPREAIILASIKKYFSAPSEYKLIAPQSTTAGLQLV